MTTPTITRKVLTIDAVRHSIKNLQKPYIHEQFLAYLHIRKRGIEQGSMTQIDPKWSEIDQLLRVEGGPPNKPFYRPISSRKKKSAAGYWLNPNIPGSYAASSLRHTSQFMLDSNNEFTLLADHAEQALKAHLRNTPQPAWMFAGYLLRNYSFPPGSATVEDLIDGFCTLFRFDASNAPNNKPSAGTSQRDADFSTLFTVGDEPDIQWFEPLAAAQEQTHVNMNKKDRVHD